MISLSKMILQSPDEIIEKSLKSNDGSKICEDFVSSVQAWLKKLKVLKSLFYISSTVLRYIFSANIC